MGHSWMIHRGLGVTGKGGAQLCAHRLAVPLGHPHNRDMLVMCMG
jgi:hypothetical protein